MSSIGSINCIRIEGPQIPALAVVMTPIDRTGVNGTIFRSDAQKVPEITLRSTTTVTTLALANAAADTFNALVGSLVTITDDLGLATSSVMILAVRVDRVQNIKNFVGDNNINYLVSGIWLVKPTL